MFEKSNGFRKNPYRSTNALYGRYFYTIFYLQFFALSLSSNNLNMAQLGTRLKYIFAYYKYI